jgi:hypothetical protein
MTPFRTFTLYHAVKLHFSSGSYDAFKYNFKTNVTERVFWKRKDKYFFGKLARRYNDEGEFIKLLVANFLAGNNWIGEITEDNEEVVEWNKNFESLMYIFEEDISKLSFKYDSFKELFDKGGSVYYNLINDYLNGDVKLNTVVIIELLKPFIMKSEHMVDDPIMWPGVRDKILNYAPFLSNHVDRKRAAKIIVKHF